LEYLATRLPGFARNVVVLQGGLRAKERRAALDQLAAIPDSEERLVLATGRYVGEGLDDARLDTLFLALPIAWKGTLVQYAGRLTRLHPQRPRCGSMTTWTRRSPCVLGCTRSGCGDIVHSGTRSTMRKAELLRVDPIHLLRDDRSLRTWSVRREGFSP